MNIPPFQATKGARSLRSNASLGRWLLTHSFFLRRGTESSSWSRSVRPIGSEPQSSWHHPLPVPPIPQPPPWARDDWPFCAALLCQVVAVGHFWFHSFGALQFGALLLLVQKFVTFPRPNKLCYHTGSFGPRELLYSRKVFKKVVTCNCNGNGQKGWIPVEHEGAPSSKLKAHLASSCHRIGVDRVFLVGGGSHGVRGY